MTEADGKKRTQWHRLLAKLLEETLKPVGILVFADFPIMGNPPETDILLLRNKKKEWTPEQKARLDDGIRDCRASHVLLEFKYTESVNRKAILQTICYDHLYKQSKNLAEKDVRTFLVSSKTPVKKTLEKYGYGPSAFRGVFRSENILLKNIPLISLNDLANKPHNAFFKLFASRQNEKRVSFYSLSNNIVVSSNPKIQRLVEGLATFWFYRKGENAMKDELTTEMVMALGKKFHDALISSIPREELLATIPREELLATIPPEELLATIPLEELLATIPLEELLGTIPLEKLLAGLEPEEIFEKYGKDKIVAKLTLEDRLAGLSDKDLEICLEKLKRMKK